MSVNVLAKPIGPRCNLACTYCFYGEKTTMFPAARRMDDALLDTFVRDCIARHERETLFTWQGGEPTLLGLDFFHQVLALQRRYRRPGQRIVNALQTNGTLLDAAWARFLADHGFLVGLSLDGPRRLHDAHRRDRQGRSSFAAVVRAVALLHDHGVAFNTLTVVHRDSVRHGRQIYRFLRGLGVKVMQFIPLVERVRADGGLAGPPPLDREAAVARWSVPPAGFGVFLCSVFDEWLRGDVGRVFVQMFDVHLGLWAGQPSQLCVFAETCGKTPALEHDGGLYPCDHYVYPGYRLGSIAETPLTTLAAAPALRDFGEAKRAGLPAVCRACRYLFACNGGCPKHRFAADGTSYLCPSYRNYFSHVAPVMAEMAAHLAAGRPPALVAKRL